MRIALGADHGGFPLKGEIAELVRAAGHEPVDLGAHTFNQTDDYPDFARVVAEAIRSGQAERGILICGSGIGGSTAANKFPGIRAGLCHDTYSAHLGARFSGEERHARRLAKVLSFEKTK